MSEPTDFTPCECEHTDHFTEVRGLTQAHRYRVVQAGARRARYVGPICDPCADGHMAEYLV